VSFQAFAGVFGLLDGAFQFRSNVGLFVIFSHYCVHTHLVFAGFLLRFGNRRLSRSACYIGGRGAAAVAKIAMGMWFTEYRVLRPR